MEQWKCTKSDRKWYEQGNVYITDENGKLLDGWNKTGNGDYTPEWFNATGHVTFEKVTKQTQNKYTRTVSSTNIDVYNVLKAFEVTDQAIGHAIKKLLAGGKRGHKDLLTDWQEAIDSIARAIEIEKETHE